MNSMLVCFLPFSSRDVAWVYSFVSYLVYQTKSVPGNTYISYFYVLE